MSNTVDNKVQILNLKPSGSGGCSPEPLDWKVKKKSLVAIVNSSGAEQTLSSITEGVLVDEDGNGVTSITVDEGGFWLGTMEDKNGTYVYEDGLPAAAPRTGRIDPS